jgi:DNA-binding response OmpR family regulator
LIHIKDRAIADTLPHKRVLLVEDNPLLAAWLEEMLSEEGAEIVGPALTLRDGLELLKGDHIDAAVLDIELGGCQSWPIAEELQRQATPFVFLSSRCQESLPSRFGHIVCLSKPAEPRYVIATVEELVAA